MKFVPHPLVTILAGTVIFMHCATSPDPDLSLPNFQSGLYLPHGFEATVVIDSIKGKAREIAVNDNGDIYVKLSYPDHEGGCAVLRDTTGDGRADMVRKFGVYERTDRGGYQTAMRIHNGYLYFSTNFEVYRFKLTPDKMVPDGPMELVFRDDHAHGNHEHIAKPVTFDNDGNLFIPFGVPSNACQEPKRTPGGAGLDPCPQLEDHGGVWKFPANQTGMTQRDGVRYATGIRSVVAMDWNHEDNDLYVVMHGRDDLFRLFPNIFSAWESALLPAEEFIRVREGGNYGWPYCYYDQMKNQKVLAPEYGGDGTLIGRCDEFDDPLLGFPGHWAPNGLFFYRGDQFPSRYKNGAFVAMHGSTNRTPYPQSGYFVAFVPFENGSPTGDWEVFADGFAGVDTIANVSEAVYRPMGISMGPDGSLYLSETEEGKIWKVRYSGEKEGFGPGQLASMEVRKELPHIKTPDEERDNLRGSLSQVGESLYYKYCSTCHQDNGRGAQGRWPPLSDSEWVSGDKQRLIEIVLKGMEGEIEVNGMNFNEVMPHHAYLKDMEIAEILTYIRQNFGNSADPITEDEVKQVRGSVVNDPTDRTE